LNGKDPLDDGSADDGAAAQALERGAAEAVVFLKARGVPIVELLPYSLLMGVLVAFFGAHPSVLPRNRQLLGYWFWRATFSFRMGGEFSVIRRLYKLATIIDESAAVQALLEDAGGENRFPSFDPPPGLRSAEGKVFALFLVDAGPRLLTMGERIDVAHLLWTQKLKVFRQLPLASNRGLFTAFIHPAMSRLQMLASLEGASPDTLWSHLQASLSPAFDLVSTIQDADTDQHEYALNLGKSKRYADFDVERLAAFAAKLHVPSLSWAPEPAALVKKAHTFAEGALAAWPEFAKAHDVDAEFAATLRRHWQRVPFLKALVPNA